jgi:hypothetical protein
MRALGLLVVAGCFANTPTDVLCTPPDTIAWRVVRESTTTIVRLPHGPEIRVPVGPGDSFPLLETHCIPLDGGPR